MTNLLDLPNELLLIVAFHLRADEKTDTASLSNLTKTCRRFRGVATQFLYEQVDLNVTVGSVACFTDKLWFFARTILSTPQLGTHVRKVSLNEPSKRHYLEVLIYIRSKYCEELRDHVLAMLPEDELGNGRGSCGGLLVNVFELVDLLLPLLPNVEDLPDVHFKTCTWTLKSLFRRPNVSDWIVIIGLPG
jgi:hypothetical protein